MLTGNIAAWKKNEGDSVAPGDILAEVETDKATIEWEAQEEGFLAKILKAAGSKDIPVGEPVALLVEEQEDVSKFKDYTPGQESSSSSSRKPATAAEEQPAKQEEAAPAASTSSATYPNHEVLKMPALSPTMSQGNIVSWQKKVGDTVSPGDVLCEVETDKATIAWEAQEEGYLATILLPDGSKDVAVGTPAAVIVEEKDQVSAFKNYKPEDAAGKPAPKQAASAPPPPPPSRSQAEAEAKPPKEGVAVLEAQPPTPGPAAAKPLPTPKPGDRIIASPYAKKLAADAGVSLEGVQGSGPNSRIVAADVEQLIASGGGKPAPADAAVPAAGSGKAAAPEGGYTDVQLNQIKRVTAQRLLDSKLTIPHYYLTTECELDRLLEAREALNVSLAGTAKLSVNDFIVKAAALSCKKVPAVNASWMGDFIRQYHNIDINVAVASPAGLMVPFVPGADRKGLLAISEEVKALAGKAKQGKLQPHEFMGGTFTISNLGMYGIKQFAAIVNPPQAAILAVGAALPKVLEVEEGEFAEVQVMNVTLSCDHRVVDGAVGAEWMKAFKQYIENPLLMMV
eukprot:GHRR01008956.1.p1 GENE.GHRR01008956.1~~GHRR01008956.1.p1  ORF type:complete len:567 (+),score=255.19 GHRR01008956.1:268-1968(+)